MPPPSAFNGTDAVCAFLNLSNFFSNATWTPANLTDQLRAAWDVNATWLELTLINPPMRQYQMAKCVQDANLFRLDAFGLRPGRISKIWCDVVVCGILAWISICFNSSLIVVTFRHIKEHRVCNWLLAFDALCQLFSMNLFVVNMFAWMFGISVIDIYICMAVQLAIVMGIHSTMMTIFLISLERMLLTVAPVRLSQLQTPRNVRICSVVGMCMATAFGFYMSCATLLYANAWLNFNFFVDSNLYCIVGTAVLALKGSNGYILLLLALLDYAIIFVCLLRRYFTGVSSGESIRRVLRAVFTLTLAVVGGWLMWACHDPITTLVMNTLIWMYQAWFGIENAMQLDSFYNILNPVMAVTYWVYIVASAGGPPILYMSSTEYRKAYKKMFSRARTTTTTQQVAPAFIQRRYEGGITTQAARDTTVAAA